MAERTPLEASLFGLSGLELTPPFDVILTKIASFGVSAIPGAEGAGLALVSLPGKPDTVIATDPFVQQVDDAQYALDEGPCVAACSTRSTQLSDDLRTDRRWPHFAKRVAEMKVASALSLPLIFDDRVLGCLNVYGRPAAAFTPSAARTGELFAEPAAALIVSADLLVRNRAEVEQLTRDFASQALVHEAVGIVKARTGKDSTESLDILRRIADSQRVDVASIASSLSRRPTMSLAPIA